MMGAARTKVGSEGRTVIVADCAGACYGVERALRLAREALRAAGPGRVTTLGPLIHNPQVVSELADQGVRVADSVSEIGGGTMVIRSHGVAPQVLDAARERGLSVVDATCPYVAKVQHAARRLADQGFVVIVVGEKGHPEVEGICGWAGDGCLVADGADALPDELPGTRVGVVVQTTQTAAALAEVVAALVPRTSELRVINTICQATARRQEAAARLASAADAMVVVGGRNSGNTTRLAQICAERCPRTHHVERAQEVEAAWLAGARTIGVTAGASTPMSQIDEVVARIREL